MFRSRESLRAFFGGLVQCASVWGCPVCCAKIQERRAHEISSALHWVYTNSYKAVMVTYTHSHKKGDSLSECIEKHNKALRVLRAGEPYARFRKSLGVLGVIRGSEVTYGNNGWHFHTHEILIVKATSDITEWESWLKERWLGACEKVGFTISDKASVLEHGCDILKRDGKVVDCHASDYLAKFGQTWGIDKELSKGASKIANSDKARDFAGKTPFDLVSRENLFLEYLEATKGKSQLFWSKGLKKLVGLVDKTDEQLVEENEDNADLIAKITNIVWKVVIDKEERAKFLEYAEIYGLAGVLSYLQENNIADSEIID